MGTVWTLVPPVADDSIATFLMCAPGAIDAVESEANNQNVAIQRTTLLGAEVTQQDGALICCRFF